MTARADLLRAAADVLSEQGMAASMNAIAQRAGVTKMTLYRHFASKEDLVLAVMADHFDRLRIVVEGLSRSALAPLDAVEAYLERAICQIGPDRRYFHVAMMAGGANAEIHTSAMALDSAVEELLDRARAAHAIRADVVAGDVHALVMGMSSTFAEDWRRYLRLTLAGLGALDADVGEPAMRREDYKAFQAEQALRRRRGEFIDAPN